MNGASKILTVSYGTFSCTLEGFDDPFNTMKAIAEYFRDLAAEDRYFGAEPPQPDAAMLHKIAEREIQRRVEAKIQDNGVILRAEETEALAPPRGPALPAARSDLSDSRPQPVVEMPARAPTRPAPVLAQPDTGASHDAGAESVAEKLSRLRKATAETQESVSIVAAQVPLATAPDHAFAEDDLADLHADSPALSAMEEFADILPEDDAAKVGDIIAEDLPPEAQTAEEMPAEDVDAEDLEDLLALDAATNADLAAVDQTPAQVDIGDSSVTQGSAESDLKAEVDVQSPDLEEEEEDTLLASVMAEEAPPVAAPTSKPDHSSDEEADDALLASLGALIDPEEQTAEQSVTTATAQPDPQSQVDEAPFADLEEDKVEAILSDDVDGTHDAVADLEDLSTPATLQNDLPTEAASLDFAAAPEADQIDAAPAEPAVPVRPVRPVRAARPTAIERPTVPADLVADLTSDAIAETESRTPISVEKLQRARARVIKIRRSEAAPLAETVTLQSVAPTAQAAPAAASLSDEAEAALAAELASLEQDSPSTAAAPALVDAAPERRLARPAEDVAVNRLMAEARTQMEVPDTKRRQSAIAHLKAAVAATIAERRATGSTLAGNGSERLGAYRNDLAKVVRPSPETSPATGERPSPLVLVSEQRIDRQAEPAPASALGAAPAVQPVRPRRPVPAATAAAQAFAPELDDMLDAEDEAGNIFEADSGFPDFAERLGATDLPDLLEAAAAYIACVEGRDSFTRPQLMRHINAAAEGLSREDGLRSFGTLLRDGVIERSRRGQFAISEGSPLLAEARKIAG